MLEASMKHISDDDLERYHLAMIDREVELAPLEEHLLICQECIPRAVAAGKYVEVLRAALAEYESDFSATVQPDN